MADGQAVEGAAAGLLALSLLTDPQTWVHRRVEAVELLDDRIAERRVSLDLTVPAPPFPELPWLPVTALKKGKIDGFDIVDNEGRSLPVLTRRQNGDIAADALVALAETLVGESLDPWVRHRVREVAIAPPRSAVAALVALRTPGTPSVVQRNLVVGQPLFERFARLLSQNFMLLAAVTPRPGERRIVKLRYRETFDVSKLGSLSQRFGWKPLYVPVAVPAVADGTSYHIEFSAPPEAEIAAAYLAAEHPDGRGATDTELGPLDRVHLYLSSIPYGSTGTVGVWLRARRAGFLRAALLTSLLTLALLVAARFNLDGITTESEAPTTVLVLVPGLLAAYLTRPGEHELVATALSGVRAALVATAASAIAAASALAGGVTGSGLYWLWGALIASAGAAFAVQVFANLLPRIPLEVPLTDAREE